MKVVHLSTTDFGGAYKAAARISECVKLYGVDSEVLIRSKKYENTVGQEIFKNNFEKIFSKIKNLFNLILSKGEIISDYFGTNITKYTKIKEADIIVLHWVNSFISYRGVEQLQKMGKPIVWVMHDMWLFTGGCHIDQFCGGYEKNCIHCPFLDLKNSTISKCNYKRKCKMLNDSDIVLVGPSEWIVECAKKSKITNRQEIVKISNPIDTAIFYRRNNEKLLREKFGIPQNRKVILFGAMRSNEDKNKGFQFLEQALSKLEQKDYVIVVFGNISEIKIPNVSMEIISLGMINDENILAELYSCADVFVAPSLQESFGYTVSEALACGTPVVAHRTTGILDQIQHKKNGYLISIRDSEGLKKGIEWCVNNRKSMENYLLLNNNYLVIGQQYLDLFNKICNI